jgi:hypothetical protein
MSFGIESVIPLYVLFLDALLTGERALDSVLLLRAVPVPVDWVIRLRARVSCKQKTIGFLPLVNRYGSAHCKNSTPAY